MRGDGLIVGVDLAEQQRLHEAPGSDQGVAIVERGAQRKGLEHVALKVDVALQIGLGDVAFIERPQRPEGAVVAETDTKFGVALADIALLPVWQFDREGRGHAADTVEKGVERGCGR